MIAVIWTLLKAVPLRTWALLAFLAAIVGAQLYLHHRWVAEGRSLERAAIEAERMAATEQALRESEAARARENEQAQAFVDLAAKFYQDKQNAKAQADAVVSDLRAGNLRLRHQWEACVSGAGQAAAGSGGTDADADDRIASAGRIIGAAAQCDAHVTALQNLLRLERQ